MAWPPGHQLSAGYGVRPAGRTRSGPKELRTRRVVRRYFGPWHFGKRRPSEANHAARTPGLVGRRFARLAGRAGPMADGLADQGFLNDRRKASRLRWGGTLRRRRSRSALSGPVQRRWCISFQQTRNRSRTASKSDMGSAAM